MLELATAAVNVLGAVLQVGAGALALVLAVRHVRQKETVVADIGADSDEG